LIFPVFHNLQESPVEKMSAGLTACGKHRLQLALGSGRSPRRPVPADGRPQTAASDWDENFRYSCFAQKGDYCAEWDIASLVAGPHGTLPG